MHMVKGFYHGIIQIQLAHIGRFYKIFCHTLYLVGSEQRVLRIKIENQKNVGVGLIEQRLFAGIFFVFFKNLKQV